MTFSLSPEKLALDPPPDPAEPPDPVRQRADAGAGVTATAVHGRSAAGSSSTR